MRDSRRTAASGGPWSVGNESSSKALTSGVDCERGNDTGNDFGT